MTIEFKWIAIIVLAAAIVAGCSQLPYDRTTETSVAGAAVGTAAGAVLSGDDDELLGSVLGGLAGAAAGYVIGARTDWFGDGNEQALNSTVNNAQANPATVADVRGSTDADLNNDGLVTRDELIAMSNAGLGSSEIIHRLEATNQVYSVTQAQRQQLLNAGVDPQVVYELNEINRSQAL